MTAIWQPWQVIDIDVACPVPTLPSRDDAGRSLGGAWVLLRVFGEPVGSVELRFGGHELSPERVVDSIPTDVVAVIRDRLRSAGVAPSGGPNGVPVDGCEPARTPPYLVRRNEVMETGPEVTAVVCTRDQPEGLTRCLKSLQAQSYPRTRLLVVDNASSTDAAREIVDRSPGPFPTRYVFEPRPGLSNARNRTLREVSTDLVAWIDDDEVADPDWLCEIVEGFLGEPHATAVCGVMVPGELETQAQYWFEEYGGHSKGRGFIRASFSPATRRTHHPLYPLPPFGTGGNMAMKASAIRALGGFDRALGAGTPTFGAEDTRALTELLLSGGTVLYQPSAITRHFHRRDYAGLRRQLYGYGAGLSAFYTSLIWDRPRLLLPLLQLTPRALRELRDPNGPRLGGITDDFPAEFLREHRRGMARGALEYARGRLAPHAHSQSTEECRMIGPLATQPSTALAAVVVCTRNRADRMERIGTNIAGERPGALVVVVDASDTDATETRCRELVTTHPGLDLHYVRSTRPGLARQRNEAARVCAGLGVSIVHFLDDDAEVLPGYFDAIERRFAGDPHLGGIGGLVQNQRVERHAGFNRMFLLSGRYPHTILKSGRVVNPQPENGALRSANKRAVQWLQGFAMSYRMSVLREHSFDERLTGYSYGEDRDFSFRVGRTWRLAVEPGARCLHLRASENRHDARRLAYESTVLTYAWVREQRGEGLSTLAFLWSAVGDLLRHVIAAMTKQPGVADNAMAYALGVLEGMVRLPRVHTVADAVAAASHPAMRSSTVAVQQAR